MRGRRSDSRAVGRSVGVAGEASTWPPSVSRRDFTRFLAAAWSAAWWIPRSQTALRVDGPRLNQRLRSLAQFGGTAGGGTSRLAYSDEDLAARAWITQQMQSAGLDVSVDAAGNLVGRRAGDDDGLPPIMLGSHTDSVPDGGNYDGQVGSMGAIEVAHTLFERDVRLRHPLEVVIFQNEEGGKTGSRALSGELQPFELDLSTASGYTIREGIARLGGDPNRLDELPKRPGEVAAYVELHIEQGNVLHQRGLDIGVVEGIVGIKRWTVTVTGFANHAGTTPMDQRRDALLAAADFIRAVHDTARGRTGRHVATVGRIEAEPGAPNVIPGRVTTSLEIRDLSMEGIDSVFTAIRTEADRIAGQRGTEFAFSQFYESRAAPTDPRLRNLIEEVADELDLASLRMPSGAGHDAQSIAQFAPVGMIFVPSVDGISHSPREFTRPAAIEAGTNVLLITAFRSDLRQL